MTHFLWTRSQMYQLFFAGMDLVRFKVCVVDFEHFVEYYFCSVCNITLTLSNWHLHKTCQHWSPYLQLQVLQEQTTKRNWCQKKQVRKKQPCVYLVASGCFQPNITTFKNNLLIYAELWEFPGSYFFFNINHCEGQWYALKLMNMSLLDSEYLYSYSTPTTNIDPCRCYHI